ncbi:TonB-dependent receptor [Rhodoferax sp.]|uniref:TonB-dependent receptor n=1 Tax=Rhodoferax sp. TaxID=50421 RepID=UPI0027595FCE|nr:TonB-dependent receptor [Rhodoferax sp.]
MKTSSAQRRDVPSSQRNLFKLGPIAAGCAVMLLVSASAQAQQAAPAAAPASATLSTVVITGIRASIESAIAVKKGSDGVVEAISAEDLGKLPDASIADSIARLPGVAAQRNNDGRASQVSVRGMPPDFATTLLNGREQVNPNDSRGAEFDAYPSELMSGVVLYKTPDASLMGQGIAGTIDLKTIRPLSVDGRKINVGVNTQKNSVGLGPTGTGNNFSLSYIDQFLDKTLGIAIGFARTSGDSSGREVNSFDGNRTFADGTKFALEHSVSNQTRLTKYTRDGVMAVVEFKPTKNFTSTLDLFSSKTDRKTITSRAAFPDMEQGTLTNAVLVGGVAVAGTITGAKHVVQAVGNQQNDDNQAIGWNNKFKLNDSWSVLLDLSKSSSKRAETTIDSNAKTGTFGSLTFDSRTTIPTFGYSLNLADTATLRLGDSPWGMGWLKKPKIEDKLDSLRLSVTYSMDNPYFSALTVGANVADRSKVLAWTEGAVNFVGGASSAALPTSTTTVPAGIPGITVLQWDPLGLVGPVYTYDDKGGESWAKARAWNVTEKVVNSFAKLDIDSSIGGMAVRGNVGVQVVKTAQSSNGFSSTTVATWGNADGNRYVVNQSGNLTDSFSYTDVLPSLNLAMDLDSSQVLRLGIGKMLARPSMRDLRANAQVECWSPANDPTNSPTSCSGNRNGNGGNTKLEPFRATSFDLAYEKYFGKRAYVGVAAFHRDLKSFIYSETSQSNVLADKFGLTGYPKINFSGPVNGQGGTIRGYELTASAPFDMLSPALSGFGAYVNFSNTDSSVSLPNSTRSSDGSTKMALPGLSKRVLNLSVYYEKDGFSARVGQRSRSDFIGEVTTNEYTRENFYIRGEKIVDVQFGYEFKTGTAKGLSLSFQVNNATDALFQKYSVNADGSQQTKESAQYGKNYMLAANYKF